MPPESYGPNILRAYKIGLDKTYLVRYNITMKIKMDSRLYNKLNSHDGLMKKKLEYLGEEALLNVARNNFKNYGNVTNSLLALRHKWLKDGYEDKTAQARHEREDNRRNLP